jgi:hypothetical protein
MPRSERLQRYIDLGFITERWAMTEPGAAERDAGELAVLEAEEGVWCLRAAAWRSFAHGVAQNGRSWAFFFHNPLSESFPKAIVICMAR